jgi:hypothetical protein
MKQLTKMKAAMHESALGFEVWLRYRKMFLNAGLAKLDKKMTELTKATHIS